MFNDLTDDVRECYEHAAHCVREATAQTDATLKQSFWKMGQRWLAMATLRRAAATRLPEMREQWWRMAASRQIDEALLRNSRVLVAQSRRLLATLESAASPHNALPIAGGISSETDHNPATLSVRILGKESRFNWTVRGPVNEVLGIGTADTELKARVDAFNAGMTYIDWLKDRFKSKKHLRLQ
jgi:hypothetical protein